MKKNIQLIGTLLILTTMIIPTSGTLLSTDHITAASSNPFDFDPLDDQIIVTITIQEIRALKTINTNGNPNFYLTVTINNNEFTSDVWQNQKYISDPNWIVSAEVPKDTEFVSISMALWHQGNTEDVLCDLSPETGDEASGRIAEMTYSIATGIWWGDDELQDPSGYGRLSGIDDGTIYEEDDDCELWFTISQTDFDEDGIPYWIETNMYNTSPLIDNRGDDTDQDGIPLEWEYTFGVEYSNVGLEGYVLVYDPFKWENQSILDPDIDGLTNIEEYKTWQWGSDPFRQDVFIEIDQMELGPNGEGSVVPTDAYDLIRDAHARHNIAWHIDDGRLGGGEFIPFKTPLDQDDLSNWYMEYFMHGDANNWRRGVFRWCIVSYDYTWAPGFLFGSRVNNIRAMDAVFLSTKYHDMRATLFPLFDDLNLQPGAYTPELNRAYVYGGGLMHETGHTQNIRAPGCDARKSVWPWQINYWVYASYKSCMNYRYVYRGLVDYSDGTHGTNDYDDWGTLDLTYFNPRTS
jgi:hypothetical protein